MKHRRTFKCSERARRASCGQLGRDTVLLQGKRAAGPSVLQGVSEVGNVPHESRDFMTENQEHQGQFNADS